MLLTFVFVDSYVSSTPNTTRIQMYEAHTHERNTVYARTRRGRERAKERDGVGACDNIVLEHKAVEEGQRKRGRNEGARWRERATIASLLVALVF